jgi:hypothetical protein
LSQTHHAGRHVADHPAAPACLDLLEAVHRPSLDGNPDGCGVVLSRYDNPILFWTVFALQCAFASLLVGTFGFIVFVLPHLTMT